MTESVLRVKSKQFAIDIIRACREMRENKVEYSLIDQLLRSGTSVGANVHEAQFAHGTKDFVSKFEIALKECNECDYWIDILSTTQSLKAEKAKGLSAECDELRKILISSVATLKKKQTQEEKSNNFN